MKLPKVSVVMSNFNGVQLGLVVDALKSILDNDYPNLEVLLVDNSSTDKSIQTIKRLFGKNKKLKIIENPINMYSQGLNLGLKNSTGEYVAYFNNDTFIDNGYFQKFIPYLEKNPNVALAQGKLVNYFNREIIDSVGETMDPYGNPITVGAGENKKQHDKVVEVLSVSGSCSILRKSAAEKIGNFDEDYGIGYEDLDLSLRAWMNNYKVIYYPNVISYHKRGATDLSPIIRVQARRHFNKNRIVTILKNFPVGFILKNLPITILIYIAAGFWEIFIKRKFALGLTRFSAMWWVFTNLHKILQKRKFIQNIITKKTTKKIYSLLYDKGLKQSIVTYIKA